jgi:hypothetical protein
MGDLPVLEATVRSYKRSRGQSDDNNGTSAERERATAREWSTEHRRLAAHVTLPDFRILAIAKRYTRYVQPEHGLCFAPSWDSDELNRLPVFPAPLQPQPRPVQLR